MQNGHWRPTRSTHNHGLPQSRKVPDWSAGTVPRGQEAAGPPGEPTPSFSHFSEWRWDGEGAGACVDSAGTQVGGMHAHMGCRGLKPGLPVAYKLSALPVALD